VRVLVTGGAGYVGSACLRWLLAAGHEAIAFDDLSEGHRAAVPEGRLVVGSIEDPVALRAALREHRCDAVMHFAALTSVPESVAEPARYYRTNLLGTKAVLDAMLECGVERILFSSTAAIFDGGQPMPVREEAAKRPISPYGRSKLVGEWLLEDYRVAYGLGYVALRYFNASGADPDGRHGDRRQHPGHLIPSVLLVARGDREILQIFGDDWPTPDGTCIRDYVHTQDLAQAHQLALEALRPGEGRTYNVGNQRGFSVWEVLRACERAVGRPIPHRVTGRRDGDAAEVVACSERVRADLGWKPRLPELDAIVETAWRWVARGEQG